MRYVLHKFTVNHASLCVGEEYKNKVKGLIRILDYDMQARQLVFWALVDHDEFLKPDEYAKFDNVITTALWTGQVFGDSGPEPDCLANKYQKTLVYEHLDPNYGTRWVHPRRSIWHIFTEVQGVIEKTTSQQLDEIDELIKEGEGHHETQDC